MPQRMPCDSIALQRFVHPRKQRGVTTECRLVFAEEFLPQRLVVRIVRSDAERAADQAACPVRRKRPQLRQWQRFAPATGEHAVYGGREVGGGVRQRTVEVEQHQPDHWRSFVRLAGASYLSGLAQRDEVVDVRVLAQPWQPW